MEEGYELIITIANKGWSEKVINVSREAGAQGAAVLHARGCGSLDIASFLGIAIEQERELVLNVVPRDMSEKIVAAISDAINLKDPSTGVSLVIPIRGILGLFKPEDGGSIF